MVEYLNNWLISIGTGSELSYYIANGMVLAGAILCSFITALISKRIIIVVLPFYIKKSRNIWDDILLEKKVFERLHHIPPALILYKFASAFTGLRIWVERISIAYMIIIGLMFFSALLDAMDNIYRTYEISKSRPIKGYIQIFKVVLFIVGIVIATGILIDKSPWILLSGVGAMAAALLIIFKETFMGLVASLQISATDMVRIGDWIEAPRYEANGTVVDITLHIIKIQNWDKSITTIPTYALISESFKNWRGMQEAGGRLIKRSIYIDITSVRFCSDEMLEKLKGIKYLKEHIEIKATEMEKSEMKASPEDNVEDFRLMTNLGLFRVYITSFLKNHPGIRQDMTLMVRPLMPVESGIPLEIYAFSAETSWESYEAVQSDIIEHILSVVPEFGLRIFQKPSGYDVKNSKHYYGE
ncbi:mechanosensitive ion channel family protein [Fonticella tunisiensis]|uniref:Miniconductance mechanosensitive channel n=1 Tax=Fonticella tunisiensis TaxID=1096341 RepID=A0A4R7KAY0_9CLOT|nr:mechanosensitive ion channel domain-containing protein [Fonticella tunisiensis]TDT52034.1 miniconductance mechanosensitive channel [Fonticella tunisiensis]